MYGYNTSAAVNIGVEDCYAGGTSYGAAAAAAGYSYPSPSYSRYPNPSYFGGIDYDNNDNSNTNNNTNNNINVISPNYGPASRIGISYDGGGSPSYLYGAMVDDDIGTGAVGGNDTDVSSIPGRSPNSAVYYSSSSGVGDENAYRTEIRNHQRRQPSKVCSLLKEIMFPLVLVAFVVIGGTTQNVTLVLWLDSFGTKSKYGGTYFVLLYGAVFFVVVFGLLLFLTKLFRWNSTDLFWGTKKSFALLVLIGFFDALGGTLLVYASPPSRTPPVIQAIVRNCAVLFGIPFSKILLRDRKRYFHPGALVAALLLVVSVTLSVLPMILTLASDHDEFWRDNRDSLIWCAIFVSALIPHALYNVLQEAYMKNKRKEKRSKFRGLEYQYLSNAYYLHNEEHQHQQQHQHQHQQQQQQRQKNKRMKQQPPPPLQDQYSSIIVEQQRQQQREKRPRPRPRQQQTNDFGTPLTMLFWSCLFQLGFVMVFFAVDIIPWFGFARSITQFGNFFVEAAQCNFFGLDCHYESFLYGILFNVGYVITYLASAGLNRDSANFSMLSQILVAPVCVLFWMAFPHLNPAAEKTPWWSVAPALLCTFVGLVIWKLWETFEQRRVSQKLRQEHYEQLKKQHHQQHANARSGSPTTSRYAGAGAGGYDAEDENLLFGGSGSINSPVASFGRGGNSNNRSFYRPFFAPKPSSAFAADDSAPLVPKAL